MKYRALIGVSLVMSCLGVVAIVAMFVGGRAQESSRQAVVPPATRFIERPAEAATETAHQTVTPSAALMPQSTATAPALLTNADWQPVLSNPQAYKGRLVELSGKIFVAPETQGDAVVFQMFTTDRASDGNTIVVYRGPNKLKRGDYVLVWGAVVDELQGKNAFGATVRAPGVVAEAVGAISPAGVIAPAKLTANVNSTENQHGLMIAVDSIEMADEETRVNVRVKNASSRRASISTYGALLAQGSRQFETKRAWDYPQLPSTILPDIVAEGVLVFEPIDRKAGSARLVWAGPRLDDYSLDFAAYDWTVRWDIAASGRWEGGRWIPGN